MDTLTHGLAGALLARALPGTGDAARDRAFARREAWLGFCAAMFPDADALVSPFSPEFYITQHRGLTHSFVLLPVWALVLAAAASLRPPAAAGPPGGPGRRIFRASPPRRLGRRRPLARPDGLDHVVGNDVLLAARLVALRARLGLHPRRGPHGRPPARASCGMWVVSRRGLARSRLAARAGLVAATAYVLFCGVRHAEAVRLVARLAPSAGLARRDSAAGLARPLAPPRRRREKRLGVLRGPRQARRRGRSRRGLGGARADGLRGRPQGLRRRSSAASTARATTS